VSGALGVTTDVTDRVTAAEQVAASEERWRSLVSHSADAAVITDRSGCLTYVSPAVTRLFGCLPAELVGTSRFALAHPDDLPMVEAAVEKSLTDPDVHPVIEYRLRASGGSGTDGGDHQQPAT
jgi:PAS domain S-box-containing protein